MRLSWDQLINEVNNQYLRTFQIDLPPSLEVSLNELLTKAGSSNASSKT